jgi:phage protein D
MSASLQYSPAYSVEIKGKPLPAAVRSSITSIRYEDGRNESDRVEISLANPDLRWLQHHVRGIGVKPFPTQLSAGMLGNIGVLSKGTFDIDNKLSLSLGYAPEQLTQVFKGEITGVQANFPSSGMPTMSLVAHDYLHRMQQGTNAIGFGPLPDAIVASIISAKNLLLPQIDPAITMASAGITALNVIFKGAGLKQGSGGQGESDFELLKRIATDYDADFWVEGDVFYLARFSPRAYSPALTLKWGESLIDFSPQVTTVGKVEGIAMRFPLQELGVDFVVSVFWDFDREALGISVKPGPAAKVKPKDKDSKLTIIDQIIKSPGDVASSAAKILHLLRQKLNNRLTASGNAVGNTKIKAGSIIRFEGLGPDFSGDYRVSSATHSIDSGGYRTSFEVRKEIIP